jgi:hypothetical protein
MKIQTRRVLLAVALGGVLSAGCSSTHRVAPVVVTSSSGGVAVAEAPPPLRAEVRSAPPGSDYVWVRGFWTYADGHYVWVPGRYELRPRAEATWVDGYWEHTTTGWVYVQGTGSNGDGVLQTLNLNRSTSPSRTG